MTANPAPHEGLLIRARDSLQQALDPFKPIGSKAVAEKVLADLNQALNPDADLSSLQAQSAPFAPGGGLEGFSQHGMSVKSYGGDRKVGDQATFSGVLWECTHLDQERGNTWERVLSPQQALSGGGEAKPKSETNNKTADVDPSRQSGEG